MPAALLLVLPPRRLFLVAGPGALILAGHVVWWVLVLNRHTGAGEVTRITQEQQRRQ